MDPSSNSPLGKALWGYAIRTGADPFPVSNIPTQCPATCPCHASFLTVAPIQSGWVGDVNFLQVDRYHCAIVAVLDSACVPIDIAALVNNPWILPHKWRASPETNFNIARAMELRGPPLKFSDEVLDLMRSLPSPPVAFVVDGEWRAMTGDTSFPEYASALCIKVANGRIAIKAAATGATSGWTHIEGVPPYVSHNAEGQAADAKGLGKAAEIAVCWALHHEGYEVNVTASRARSADLQIRTDAGLVMVEVKDYSRAVPTAEIEKFERDIVEGSAAAGLMITAGCTIAGNQAGRRCITRMVPTACRGLCPMMICQVDNIDSRTEVRTACSASLSALDAITKTCNSKKVQLTPEEGAARRLETAGEELARAQATLMSSITASVESRQTAVAALQRSAAAVFETIEHIRAETNKPSSWEEFVDSAAPMQQHAMVKQVWERGTAWSIKKTAAQRTATSAEGYVLRFLATATRATFPLAHTNKAARAALVEAVVLRAQKHLKIQEGNFEITLAPEAAPLLHSVLSALLAAEPAVAVLPPTPSPTAAPPSSEASGTVAGNLPPTVGGRFGVEALLEE